MPLTRRSAAAIHRGSTSTPARSLRHAHAPVANLDRRVEQPRPGRIRYGTLGEAAGASRRGKQMQSEDRNQRAVGRARLAGTPAASASTPRAAPG